MSIKIGTPLVLTADGIVSLHADYFNSLFPPGAVVILNNTGHVLSLLIAASVDDGDIAFRESTFLINDAYAVNVFYYRGTTGAGAPYGVEVGCAAALDVNCIAVFNGVKSEFAKHFDGSNNVRQVVGETDKYFLCLNP